MTSTRWLFALALIASTTSSLAAVRVAEKKDEKADDKPLSAETFSGLKLRTIGPAFLSGRICDFAINPENESEYYVAVCSGGVWKTENAGVTYEPIFDGQASYSIGCITLDPNNPHVVWVGSGENNSQRSVSFGDGVYRSRDGGKSWENLGLKESEHIGKIIVDPRDSNTVYVAAQGPLWRSGGDRGLYKTTDGGQTWNRILHVSDDTGVNEVHMDPRNPDVLYASSYQRRRHVWTLVNGGPESNIYKSTDAGQTWRKVTSGLPGEDKGRIGMCIAPSEPDIIYAIVEASNDKGGVFRSTDRGETWKKRSGYMSSSPQYYNEIVCDPHDEDRVYSLDTFMHVTEDGGKSFQRVPREDRHVDDHALWIDPADENHLLVGSDGGIYESWDRGENWQFKPNLPITQYYRINVDNSTPFYYVYGGTQDNNSQGGPSRTISPAGITSEDWFVTVGGDGYETVVDPEDPNIVYSQWQYGGLIRHDRRSGEIVDIKPREAPGEPGYRWNWDSPLIMSPHDHERLYFAANKLFRTNDRGDSWTVISDDLTRQLDRNQLEVMGKIQSVDAVSKNRSTSIYGNAVALSESPLQEGLIYVGTDDGVLSITGDGGNTWRRVELFPEIPDMTYISCVLASRHQADRVYVSFDNHKNGDFAPYILRSDDRGQTWKPVAGDLPKRDTVYSLVEDAEKEDLLFAGTEFGVYFTINGGTNWIQLKGGIPTIAVRDVEIQRRENDLVAGTFGRGIYILDNYTPLRHVSAAALDQESILFPVKEALIYIERSRLGGRSGRGSQGASYYNAPNPPYGAVFTYYLREKLQTREEKRQETEKKTYEAGKTPPYPTLEELRAEDEERDPNVWLIVRDEDGNVIRRVEGSRNKGVHRVSWDLRYPSPLPVRLSAPEPEGEDDDPRPAPAGPLVLPGTYNVTLAKEVDGTMTDLSEPVSFDVVPLDLATFAAEDKEAAMAFHRRVARLQRAVMGAGRAMNEYEDRIKHLRKAFADTPDADRAILTDLEGLTAELNKLSTELNGDRTAAKHQEATAPSIRERVGIATQWYVTSAPTQTQRDAYDFAGEAFTHVLQSLRVVRDNLNVVEQRLEAAGAPWTPGRLPDWEPEE